MSCIPPSVQLYYTIGTYEIYIRHMGKLKYINKTSENIIYDYQNYGQIFINRR